MASQGLVGDSFKNRKHAPVLGIKLGYTRTFGWFVPQASLSYLYSPSKARKTFIDTELLDLDTTSEFNFKHNFALDLKPGIKVYERFCVYPLLGITLTQRELKAILNATSESSKSIQTIWGWNLGFGGRFLINDKFDIDAEFKYIGYRSKQANFHHPASLAGNSIGYKPKIKAFSYMIGINYRF